MLCIGEKSVEIFWVPVSEKFDTNSIGYLSGEVKDSFKVGKRVELPPLLHHRHHADFSAADDAARGEGKNSSARALP